MDDAQLTSDVTKTSAPINLPELHQIIVQATARAARAVLARLWNSANVGGKPGRR
jgi:hypothetical protein